MKSGTRPGYRSFALVLAGGGVRGLAHIGVLRALEHCGWQPSAIVGVSMGAIVGVTYGLNPDWYRALVNMDTRDFPESTMASSRDMRERVRALLASERALREMILGWGVGSRSLEQGQALLSGLTLGRNLGRGRIPLAAVAMDLMTGHRIILTRGNAARAIYASSALPGILPPLRSGAKLLADGSYVDNAPIDVARDFGVDLVLAVDTSQMNTHPDIHNGLQAMVRAVEICHYTHARLRFNQADYVLRPVFPFSIDALDFRHKRLCVATGIRAVRGNIEEIRHHLTGSRRQENVRAAAGSAAAKRHG